MPPPGIPGAPLSFFGLSGFRGDQKPGDRRRILQRRPHNLGWVDNAFGDGKLVAASKDQKPPGPQPFHLFATLTDRRGSRRNDARGVRGPRVVASNRCLPRYAGRWLNSDISA
jgi:hypothetical protein